MIGTMKPTLDKSTGLPLLYDLFIDGKWIGSRRTFEQATAVLAWVLWPSRRKGDSL